MKGGTFVGRTCSKAESVPRGPGFESSPGPFLHIIPYLSPGFPVSLHCQCQNARENNFKRRRSVCVRKKSFMWLVRTECFFSLNFTLRESLAFKLGLITTYLYSCPALWSPSRNSFMIFTHIRDLFLDAGWSVSSLVLLKYIFSLSKLMTAGDARYLVKKLHCHWFVKSNILQHAKCLITVFLMCFILLVQSLKSWLKQ